MKILIIGASGMLARPVVEQFSKHEFELRLFSRSIKPEMFGNKFETLQGDVYNSSDLEKAMDGCQAVHINLSQDEGKATRCIVDAAIKKQIQIISIISGFTVREENRWFPMIEEKFSAEQAIIQSGISYMIFRPSWFFESLELMVRDGKITMIGKQPSPYRWIAANDYARMVIRAYQLTEARNKIFYIYGTESILMKDALEKYREKIHPEIKKISPAPIGILKVISFLTRNKELKNVASMFGYFEKVKEPEVTDESWILLGKPEINFDKWIEMQKIKRA